MLVPTLPEARYLILDDADVASLVSVALASERWGGRGEAPVVAAAWWRAAGDETLPLVHRAVERQASLFGLRRAGEELAIGTGPDPFDPSQRSELLLAACRLAVQIGCDAVLYPVRAAEDTPDASLSVDAIAREVDRAALVSRLFSLEGTGPIEVVTPVVDLNDEQVGDLARDLGVPVDATWWGAAGGDPLAREASVRWRSLRGVQAGEPAGQRLVRTA